jgi:hypothetical protein
MPRPKMVFVAHPMSGDIRGNTRKVVAICRQIHTEDVIPVFPSFTWRKYLTKSNRDIALAVAVNKAYFHRDLIDEVWLFGDHLTAGMRREIRLAQQCGISVVPKTLETDREYRRMSQ